MTGGCIPHSAFQAGVFLRPVRAWGAADVTARGQARRRRATAHPENSPAPLDEMPDSPRSTIGARFAMTALANPALNLPMWYEALASSHKGAP